MRNLTTGAVLVDGSDKRNTPAALRAAAGDFVFLSGRGGNSLLFTTLTSSTRRPDKVWEQEHSELAHFT